MGPKDDDLDWDDDPLVRALRAPGTPDELSGEAGYRAAFRAQQRRGGSVRRLVGRLGIGATTAVTTVALSAGVAAAAYTQVLPDPVQRFAHGVLGPVGVPAPEHRHPRVRLVSPGTTTTPSTPTPSRRPGGSPSRAPHPGTKTSAPPLTVVTTAPAPTPTATPTAPPASPGTGVRRVPAAVTVSVTAHKVAIGSGVSVSGTVTSSDGHVLRNRLVRLVGRTAGQPWTRLATGTTDASGHVTLQSPALNQNVRVRLSAGHGVHSAGVAIVVVPTISATAAEADGTSTVTVTTEGGRAGDVVTAYRYRSGELVRVGSATLDAHGSAVLAVPTPKRQLRIVLRLPATRQHGAAQTAVKIGVQ